VYGLSGIASSLNMCSACNPALLTTLLIVGNY